MREERFLRLPEVMEITGIGRAAVYKKVKTGEFPRPVKLGRRTTAWVASEIQARISHRIAMRDEGVT